ncbi:hypothetical protein VOLCADRAFT_96700 [Volvox carteri f. nagariensis]|uniref:Uncharacterized protein n=1 Tax=Volvox carteri f. nagariensis TaxID=3068 RepID=D8UAU1_VOLCA|nr:uncharacterized protein VOLCADRAFT_96700 [Volvox carteri f. nagariensis]EFJ43216.1 hypothetical protein VOLCADRAFT_96700 [Volvox carteri f. nagariensis]|eukprot:XP_002955791.1 hypothetical protein VOLCADRAFT_96700 [Volvox carteri f. nagariensis]
MSPSVCATENGLVKRCSPSLARMLDCLTYCAFIALKPRLLPSRMCSARYYNNMQCAQKRVDLREVAKHFTLPPGVARHHANRPIAAPAVATEESEYESPATRSWSTGRSRDPGLAPSSAWVGVVAVPVVCRVACFLLLRRLNDEIKCHQQDGKVEKKIETPAVNAKDSKSAETTAEVSTSIAGSPLEITSDVRAAATFCLIDNLRSAW